MTPDTTTTKHLNLLPFDRDPLDALAETLLQEHRETLPLLEQVTVLLPDSGDAPRLRLRLLQQAEKLGYHALLGPRIIDWHHWLSEQTVSEQAAISDYRRELILVQALRKHSKLFGEANHWALADSLLQLFDELTLNRIGVPQDIDEFHQRIAKGYGLTPYTLHAMERETQLVHTLWQAWHQELKQRNLLDRNARYLLQLSATLAQPFEKPLYLLAPAITCAAEREWLAAMATKSGVRLLLHGHITPDATPNNLFHPETPLRQILTAMEITQAGCNGSSDYSRLLDQVFAAKADTPLRQRAEAFATQIPTSPLKDRLAVFATESDEEEARAVELQVRRWLLEGKRRIGIVSENRRLARRVRALLERANIAVEDTAGWALSTTSAAAVLERWLQCIEEDFPHQAMLDLLKSPFFCAPEERDDHLSNVYMLERDIVLHENIGSGIKRYRQSLKYRQHRLPPDLATRLDPVDNLLEQLQQAAQPLQKFNPPRIADAAEMLQLLLQSMTTLELTTRLGEDPAGMRLLEELQKMAQAASGERHAMTWMEFRSWLGRTLERYDFKPASPNQPVIFMELTNSSLGHFDALIIASAEREQLPGTAVGSPFFNDTVKHELGLSTADERLAGKFYHFRRLLEAAPVIFITHCILRQGEQVLPSPWLELLLAFHKLAYDSETDDLKLKRLLAEDATLVIRPSPLPESSEMPHPTIDPALLPKRYSAGAYQQLMECPYQFFAARGLGLAPPDAIREALEKSDYGERVHRCLQAFHGGVDKLPGPFSGEWKAERREEAIALLAQISDAVFARDLEDNYLHRGWLQRWKQHIPNYIDWQIERAESWQVVAVEQQLQQERTIPGGILHGRLDRVDSNGESLAIIDYKTGGYAKPEMVSKGEAVQLPFYALLAAESKLPVERVEYLALDENKVNGRTLLEGDKLTTLSQQVGERLALLQQQMRDGTELPAWGTEENCGYCRFTGICRRAEWLEK